MPVNMIKNTVDKNQKPILFGASFYDPQKEPRKVYMMVSKQSRPKIVKQVFKEGGSPAEETEVFVLSSK